MGKSGIAMYSVLTIFTVAFAIKAFLYGGTQFQDPNDSPLYESRLKRALNNFKASELVLCETPLSPSPRLRRVPPRDLAATYFRTGLSLSLIHI